MKKLFILVAISVLALSACNNAQEQKVEQEPVEQEEVRSNVPNVKGPTAPPQNDFSPPTAPPDVQAVTRQEDIKLSLPVEN